MPDLSIRLTAHALPLQPESGCDRGKFYPTLFYFRLLSTLPRQRAGEDR